jgi:hypothetical protein
MDTPNNSYLDIQPDLGENTPSLSISSPRESTTSSSESSLVPTPAATVLELPKQVLRDPHTIPDFDQETLTHSGEPILFLPPFLSSLPHAYSSHKSPPSNGRPVPQTTESVLPDIDSASLSLHQALHNFTPITEKYADVSYAEAFNWGELDLPEDDEHEWYCVSFRSIRKRGSASGRQSTSFRLPDFCS